MEGHAVNLSTGADPDMDLDMATYSITTLTTCLIMCLLCAVGFYGNVVSIFIFTKPIMRRSSINILLTGLSAIDLSVLILAVLVFVLPSLNETFKFEFMSGFYPFIILVLYPLATVAQTCSIWTFVLISVERFVAVCYPLNVNKYMTTGRTKFAQGVVVFLAVSYNIVRFWEFVATDELPYLEPYLRQNSYYFAIYSTGLYLFTHFLLPFGLILILNIRIAEGINLAHMERRRMTGIENPSAQNRTTRMIVVVTSMFGVCNSLAFILNIWEAIKPNLFQSELSVAAYLLLDISNIAVILNCSTTFVIYLIYCKKYRTYFYRYRPSCKASAHIEISSEDGECHGHSRTTRNWPSTSSLRYQTKLSKKIMSRNSIA